MEDITKGYKQALSQDERRQMLKREKTRTDLMARFPLSPDDSPNSPKRVLSSLKEGEASKKPISISEIIRQPTNRQQQLRRESASALILDAIAQKVSLVPKGTDLHRRGSFLGSLDAHGDPKPGGE